MHLSELSPGVRTTILRVIDQSDADPIATRLRDLGFVAGEAVSLVGHGPFGAEPLLVQIGFTRFALRRSEAARVEVAHV